MLEKYTRLPESRAQRRTVLVLDRGDIEALEVDPSSRDIFNREDVAVLYAGTDLASADPLTQSLDRKNLLIPGQVLVASPYRDGDYTPLAEAKDRFSLEKWSLVSTLCAYLGASSLDVKTLEDIQTHERVEVTAGGAIRGIGAKAKGESSDLQRFAAQMHLQDVYVGGIGNLDLAEKHLRDSGLEADAEIRSLVDARRHTGNLLARRTLSVDLSREAERSLDLTLSITPPVLGGIQAAFNKAAQEKMSVRLNLEIVFPEVSNERHR